MSVANETSPAPGERTVAGAANECLASFQNACSGHLAFTLASSEWWKTKSRGSPPGLQRLGFLLLGERRWITVFAMPRMFRQSSLASWNPWGIASPSVRQ
ncbi:hypothetical protein CSOJ01_05065 [Colletotrichum sojae]|uniref:Uncharacterized protein n=1 Tax=Colletotrichum sojae TaxID=2175907 RepID=A0A8H6JHD6_9PEZI|nr:hypothetical protein CSOJ01_05065 [Colletotrichum sojae]